MIVICMAYHDRKNQLMNTLASFAGYEDIEVIIVNDCEKLGLRGGDFGMNKYPFISNFFRFDSHHTILLIVSSGQLSTNALTSVSFFITTHFWVNFLSMCPCGVSHLNPFSLALPVDTPPSVQGFLVIASRGTHW